MTDDIEGDGRLRRRAQAGTIDWRDEEHDGVNGPLPGSDDLRAHHDKLFNHPPEHFAQAAWYDAQYSGVDTRYGQIYGKDIPPWAEELNLYAAHMVAAYLALSGKNHTVLDCGSGVGRFLRTWQSFGFHAMGVEFSREAVKLATEHAWNTGQFFPNIFVADIRDLTGLFNEQKGYTPFDLAFSADVLEHILPGEDSRRVITEAQRVARFTAHYIPMEVGGDPSHVHIQSKDAWVAEFHAALGSDYWVVAVDNPTNRESVLYLTGRDGDMPWPVKHLLLERAKS